LVATNIFLISPQRKWEIQLPQYHRIIPTTIFQSCFLLQSCETHLSYGYWGRYIGGYYCSIFLNKSRNWY
jgi:hypothetical protein